MKYSRSDSIRLCALADLLLLCCDCLRHPDLARGRMLGLQGEVGPLLEAAGVQPASPLGSALVIVLAQAEGFQPGAWSDEYHRLFEGAMLCPLNETAYVRRDKGAIIGDLCGFYSAFGFAHAAGTGEKPDHLLAQLEFLSMLLVMLAHAEGESIEITSDAVTALANDHLCDWIAVGWERLSLVTTEEYYRSVAELISQVWVLASHILDLPPTQAVMEPQKESEDPYECIVPSSTGTVELSVNGETGSDLP